MNDLQEFVNRDFGEVRTFKDENGFVIFCATDVANCLGYSNPTKAIRDHCKEDGVTIRSVIDSKGRIQKAKFITKGNLCRLVASSKLKSAEKFESWIFDDVVPTVLEHGIYATDDTLNSMINNPDFGIKLLTELKTEREKSKRLESQVQEQKPLVEFATTVKGSNTNILVRQTSKLASNYIGIDIGERGLYQKLREWGFVCWTHNEPTKRAYMQKLLEYVECKTRVYPYIDKTCMVTPKGQIYIINRLIQESVSEKEAV